ncbi:MAG: threonylcarbamoyl-AMP synthase [Candidatus Firestonebacteria bacterium]|nr:threonylcarbamoyl-AMP synthase [Candidatus Firestonebacteria bacterium]
MKNEKYVIPNLEIYKKYRDRLLELINGGGIGIFPTETVYGIGVKSSFLDDYNKIYKIKRRPYDKPLPWIISSREQLNKITKDINLPEITKKIINKWWPGPLTIVFNLNDNKSQAIRLTEHEILCEIIKDIDEPIALTSANISGDKSPIEFDDINEDIIKNVDFIIDAGKCKFGKESTIIDTSGNLIREGVIKAKEIEEFLKSLI